MTDIKTSASGFFPRPPFLRKKLREIGGLQKEGMKEEKKKKVNDLVQRAREEIIDLQTDAGIDLCVEGQLLWDDLLAYPATKIDGFEMDGLIRYYNTNRFYRRPVVERKVKEKDDFVKEDSKSAIKLCENKIKPIMPGPFTLLDLSENNYYEKNSKLIEDLSKIIEKEIKSLNELKLDFIQIDDPSLTKDYKHFEEIYKRLKEASEAELILNTYFGEMSHRYNELIETVDGVGLDLVNFEKNFELLKKQGSPNLLQLGVFDSQNTKIEDKEQIIAIINDVLEYVNPKKLFISTNLNLDFLPWPKMKEKLEKIGEVGEEF